MRIKLDKLQLMALMLALNLAVLLGMAPCQSLAETDDNCQLSIVFKEPKQKLPPGLMDKLKDTTKAVDGFNKIFKLKRPAKVIFLSMDSQYGIHCDLETAKIYIPYDDLLISYNNLCTMEEKLTKSTKKEIAQTVGQSANVSMMHEVAHLLINDYDLAVPGNEEDACDNMAAYLLAYCLDDGGSNEYCADMLRSWFEIFLASAVVEQGNMGTLDELVNNQESFSQFVSNQHTYDLKRAYNAYLASLTVMFMNLDGEDIEKILDDLASDDTLINPQDDYEGIVANLRSFAAWDKLCQEFAR